MGISHVKVSHREFINTVTIHITYEFIMMKIKWVFLALNLYQ